MNTLLDICKRSFYMNIFIVVIPLIAYMIHNGSSATVALVWYLVLSLFIPWAYLSYQSSTFGAHHQSVSRIMYVVSWAIIQVVTYKILYVGTDLTYLWELPTFARDIVFLLAMYGQVTMALIIAFFGSRLLGGTHE